MFLYIRHSQNLDNYCNEFVKTEAIKPLGGIMNKTPHLVLGFLLLSSFLIKAIEFSAF